MYIISVLCVLIIYAMITEHSISFLFLYLLEVAELEANLPCKYK